MLKSVGTLIILLGWISLYGCVGLNTYPMTAKAGETITVGVGLGYLHGGEPEKMANANTTVYIYDGGAVNYTLAPRSVFNLFPDPRSNVANYNSWLKTITLDGRPHETVVVIDLPTDIPNGSYTVEIATTVAGALHPYKSNLTIVGQGGSPNSFRDEHGIPWALTDLENCPYGEVAFSSSSTPVGAVEVGINFDDTQVPGADIRVVQPRISIDKQRNLFWRVSASTVYVYFISPEGVSNTDYLKFYVVYPKGSPDPGLSIAPTSTKVVDVDGNVLAGVTASIATVN